MKEYLKGAVITVFAVAGFLFLFCTEGFAGYPLCGDGKLEGNEECDNGQNNSDSAPNACRTDCVRARCGDYGVDNGEECDDFPNNSDEIPNACRRDCRQAHCGDGVLDTGEECDDKNTDDYDGCSQCRLCYPPKDDLVITESLGPAVRLCPGTYEFADKGQEGIVIISGQGVRVDATDVFLKGAPHTLTTTRQSQMKADKRIVQAGSAATGPSGPGNGKMPAARSPRQGSGSTPSTKTEEGGAGSSQPAGGRPPASAAAVPRQGVGIVVSGKDVVLHNAAVENFNRGIKVKGTGALLFNNYACGNSTDITAEQSGNFGIRNSCAVQTNWQENGTPGCTAQCIGN